MVILEALILDGHKVRDMKLNTSAETISKGISFTRQEETFSSKGIFKKNQGWWRKEQDEHKCLRLCDIEENVQGQKLKSMLCHVTITNLPVLYNQKTDMPVLSHLCLQAY